jgi:small-conductance mechanosensitive channel
MLAFLAGRFERLLWGAAAIVIAVALARLLKWAVHRLEQRRPGEERELLRLRRRETAIVLVATAIPYATAIVVLVVVASIFVSRNAAALGGSAFVGVLVGFAATRCSPTQSSTRSTKEHSPATSVASSSAKP